jgi:hypothetical protein
MQVIFFMIVNLHQTLKILFLSYKKYKIKA